MAKRSLTNSDGDVRELTLDDLKAFRPIQDVDAGMIEASKRGRGRPPSEDPKVHIGFRLAADIVNGIKASGRGYNARVERVLRTALSKGEL